jgi:UDP-N-acetyl-D-glucosamine dehydrogenase
MKSEKPTPRPDRTDAPPQKVKKIAVIGLGYVGLPLLLRFLESGAFVLGIDADKEKINLLQSGKSYISHIAHEQIAKAYSSGRMKCSIGFEDIADVDCCLICVPTPLTKNREPDLHFVIGTAKALAPHLKRGALVVLESTTYPGTTDTDVRQALEFGSGLVAGHDFYLAFSPEREDPGNPNSHVSRIPKVIGGLTPECLRRAVDLYSLIVPQRVLVSSCRVAEATKLMENIFRSVNIALVNELKKVYTEMGIDIWEVIEAAKTKPFGFMPFYPGPGLGGHCIPIDPFYLTWKAREFGLQTRFIELAGEINTSMPDYVLGRVVEALNNEGKPIRGSRILILGLAYKPNVDDDRESPAYILMERLESRGAKVDYNDPFIPQVRATRDHGALAGRRSVGISDAFDAIVICTAHDAFREFDFSAYNIPVIDTRNCVSRRNCKYYQA